MRIVIEIDVDEQDVVIRVNREGRTAVVQPLAEDGGTTDAGPAPQINDE